ncbi:MAG TPA: DUF6175 family protein [Niastella sp.]
MKSALLFVIHTFLCITLLQAQENATQPAAKQVQPKIMVIPRVAEGQDMKALYDTSMIVQIGIAKINEAFQKKEANLVGFDQVLKQTKQNAMINKSSGNQEDFKSQVLGNSGADIYVEAKIDVVKHRQGTINSVTVILEGYQTGTGNMLGSKTGRSKMNATEDIGLLTQQAMDSLTTPFLELMQLKFNDIRENGQSVYVEFSLGSGSKYDFDSEIGAQKKLLSEIVDEWFQTHAYKSVYNNQGVVSNKMIISDVRIPLKNPANPKANYTGQNLYSDILKYFRTLNIPIKREIGTNNKILITII